MSIIEFDEPPSWSLNVSEIEREYKIPMGRGGGGHGGRKNRKSVTASLCLKFKWHGRILAHTLIKSISNLLFWRKRPCQIREICFRSRVAVQLWISRPFHSRPSSKHRINAVTKLNKCGTKELFRPWLKKSGKVHKFRCVPSLWSKF